MIMNHNMVFQKRPKKIEKTTILIDVSAMNNKKKKIKYDILISILCFFIIKY